MSPENRYVRREDPTVKIFYEPCREFMEETPQDMASFIEFIHGETGLPKSSENYPVDQKRISEAAEAFQSGARRLFGFPLDMESPDSAQLDCFANKHLIDPSLRRYFDGPKLRRDLSEKELEEYEQTAGHARIPREPLLYYAMGAFWGEWLVRHSSAVWALYPPLNPIQSFVDLVSILGTLCMHPFSQVTKKLCDPEGDSLYLIVKTLLSQRRFFPPYPLLASLADAEHATRELLPPSGRRALDAEKRGEDEEAFRLFSEAFEEQPRNAWLLALAIPSGWRLQKWDRLVGLLRRLLKLKPDNPAIYYHLAVAYSRTKGSKIQKIIGLYEKTLELDPHYGRAHLNLAWYLLGTGRVEEAKEHAQWVYENDPELKEQALIIIDGIRRTCGI
jgi:tetratricopeptide (TPR) repeat protein